MTNQAKPRRLPVHDLAAFDLTKRSPEQLAQSFAHWKAQRKRSLEEPRAGQPLHAQSSSAVATDDPLDASPTDGTAKASLSKRVKSVEYSSTFSELLAAGSEPTVQREGRPAIVAQPAPKRVRSPGGRLKAMSALAGAASLLALAGGAALELSDWPNPVEAHREVAQIEPQQIAVALPIVAAAASAPETEWKLQRTVDLALMKVTTTAEVAPRVRARSKTPAIQTASKTATAESEPTTPAPEKDTPKDTSFVAKPFVPAPASTPTVQSPATLAPPAAVVSSGDPRPDAVFQHNRNRSASSSGAASNREASGDKPAAATGTKSAVDSPAAAMRTATARSTPAASTGDGDPRGENSGGARVGVSGEAGGAASDADASGTTDAGGGNTGGSNTGGSDAGGSNTGTADGGSASGDASGGDTGSADAAGDSGGSATGSSDTGSGDSSDDGDADSSDGDDGNSSGVGGAIGGALDGLGDALGDALGDGKGNPDSNDKDQRN